MTAEPNLQERFPIGGAICPWRARFTRSGDASGYRFSTADYDLEFGRFAAAADGNYQATKHEKKP
jgi:hypothetical protein